MKQPIYLDNNATTAVAPEVIEVMLPFLQSHWGNPSSMHSFGGLVKRDVDQAREQVADLIGAYPDEIVFTSCGSESNNAALRGALEQLGGHPGIVTSNVEHPAIRSLCRYLHKLGHPLQELPVDTRGQLDPDQLKQALAADKAGITTIMWANNETGVIFPIQKLAEAARAADCLFHTDAVQAVGKIPIQVHDIPVDLLSFSGHKLHAPKGIGVLYIRRGVKINPFIIGGHQERGHRAGTENVPYIIGLAKACELAKEHINEEQTRVAKLRDTLERGILQTCPDTHINGDTTHRLPNTTNISFKFIEGESILLLMDEFGICASSGSACTSGTPEPSHVVMAMKVDPMAMHGSIRFSLSRYNTAADVEQTLKQLPPIVQRLRQMSPFVK